MKTETAYLSVELYIGEPNGTWSTDYVELDFATLTSLGVQEGDDLDEEILPKVEAAARQRAALEGLIPDECPFAGIYHYEWESGDDEGDDE